MSNGYEAPKIVLSQKAVICYCKKFLLVRRSLDDDWAPGRWEFPGGKVEGKMLLAANLKREVWEEISLNIQVGEVIYVEDRFAGENHPKYPGYLFVIVFRKASLVPGAKVMPALSTEHDCYEWFAPGDIFRLSTTPGTKEALIKFQNKI